MRREHERHDRAAIPVGSATEPERESRCIQVERVWVPGLDDRTDVTVPGGELVLSQESLVDIEDEEELLQVGIKVAQIRSRERHVLIT